MKRTFVYLSALVAFAGMAAISTMAIADPPASGSPAPQPQRPRIALVNIAKVLREFEKATEDGKNINTRRQYYIDLVKPKREELASLSKRAQVTANPTERERLQQEAIAINRQIEDIDQRAQKELSELTDKTVVDVYQNIKGVINDIAVTNNLDLVMCYPDASKPEEEMKPAVAELKLRTPALIPYYHRGMDITEVVVVTLNRRYPAPPSAKSPAVTPKSGVVPAKGP